MATVDAVAYMTLPLPMYNQLSVIGTDPSENEVFIGSSVADSPELSISSDSSGVNMAQAITTITSPEMLHLSYNWFSIIDDLEALQDTSEPLNLQVALEIDEEGDDDGPPIRGWDIANMDVFKAFDISTLIDVANPYAPDPGVDPNYVETSIWKGSPDGTVLMEIQGATVATEYDGSPLSQDTVDNLIADLFIDANDSFEEIV